LPCTINQLLDSGSAFLDRGTPALVSCRQLFLQLRCVHTMPLSGC